jgi:hypothetical protein
MDRQGLNQLPGGGAPRAGQPGMGVGNIPYAKGMMSGNFGQKNAPAARPDARGFSQIEPEPAPSPPSQARPGGGMPTPPPGSGMAGMMAGQTPFLQPQFLFDIYAIIMSSFLQAAEGDAPAWGYTY